jgi:dihydropteroate synthase
MLICHRFGEIALQTGKLWPYINLINVRDLAWAQLCVQRSDDMPLSIKAKLNEINDTQGHRMALLAQHFDRARATYISSTPVTQKDIVDVLNSHAP